MKHQGKRGTNSGRAIRPGDRDETMSMSMPWLLVKDSLVTRSDVTVSTVETMMTCVQPGASDRFSLGRLHMFDWT